MNMLSIDELKQAVGLRIVLVAGAPSPWSQAAKAMMEYKGLDYSAGLLMAGGANDEVVDWAGVNSAPIVAWNDERPIDRWTDILFLLERLAPDPALIPEDANSRAAMFGMSHEINGEFGIGWNRRLLIFAPIIDSGNAPDPLLQMGAKYNYNKADAALATQRTVAALGMLDDRLSKQKARGSDYFVGDTPSALDFYWTAMSMLVEVISWETIPVAEEMRPLFEQNDPAIKAAFTPVLRQHRDSFFDQYFKSPMEF